MITKTRALVLHSFKYGEQQMIVDFLTETCGRTSCIIKIPTSARGKLKKQYFQPLFILDTDIDRRQNARLQRLKDARIAVPFHLALHGRISALHHTPRADRPNHILIYREQHQMARRMRRGLCQLPHSVHDAPVEISRILSQYRQLRAGRLVRHEEQLLLPSKADARRRAQS